MLLLPHWVTYRASCYCILSNIVTVTMTTDHPSPTLAEFSDVDQDFLQGGLARRPLMRQNSKELPPLVGAPLSASASRYTENNNLNSLNIATNGSHPSPTQRRKLRYPTNLQVLCKTNKETSLSEVTTPSPPVTPRTLSDCPSPGLLRRCRQRSSISLDGSPVVRRRSEQNISLSCGRPGTPVGSPRVARSFSLGGNINEMPEQGSKLSLLGSQGLIKYTDAINDQLSNQLSFHHSSEGRNSISDQSGDTLVLKTVSQLHVVAEENVEESSYLAPPPSIEQIVDDETGEILRSKVNTPTGDRGISPHSQTAESIYKRASNSIANVMDTREVNELEDDSDEDLPDYQKKPIPTSSRIAAWLEGLSDHQLEQSRTLTKDTLPEIGNR